MTNKEELEQYLSDFDNLLDTKQFPSNSLEETTHHHKELNTVEFLSKGREFLRQFLMEIKKQTLDEETDTLYCIEIDRSGIGEAKMTVHERFDFDVSREVVLEFIKEMDCGYDDYYCCFSYYPIE